MIFMRYGSLVDGSVYFRRLRPGLAGIYDLHLLPTPN